MNLTTLQSGNGNILIKTPMQSIYCNKIVAYACWLQGNNKEKEQMTETRNLEAYLDRILTTSSIDALIRYIR